MSKTKIEITIQELRQDPGRWIRTVVEGNRVIIVAGRTRVPVAQLIRYTYEKEDEKEEEEEGPEGSGE